MNDVITRMETVIRERRRALADDPVMTETSYVARQLARGRSKLAQKLGEEAVEAVIAAMADDRAGLVSEAADLMFHLAVLLADMGLSFDDIRAELARREGVSGIDEKAGRKG